MRFIDLGLKRSWSGKCSAYVYGHLRICSVHVRGVCVCVCALIRLLAPAGLRASVIQFVAKTRRPGQLPPLVTDLIAAVADNGLPPPPSSPMVWVVGHSRASGNYKCVVIADNCTASMDLSRPTAALPGLQGAVVMCARSSWGLVSMTTMGRSFGTMCCAKSAMDGAVVLVVSPKACEPCFPDAANGCMGATQDDGKAWVVFETLACALQARAVFAAHCTTSVSEPYPWIPIVVGATRFAQTLAPVGWFPLLHWRPAPRDMRLLQHALLAVSPKGCARVVIDDPGFVGVVTGRHAEEATRDKDWMLFKSFEDARRVRSERLAGFCTSLPCPRFRAVGGG